MDCTFSHMESCVRRQRRKNWPLVVQLCSVSYLLRKHWLCVRLICESLWNAGECHGMSGFNSFFGLRSWQISAGLLNNLLIKFAQDHKTVMSFQERLPSRWLWYTYQIRTIQTDWHIVSKKKCKGNFVVRTIMSDWTRYKPSLSPVWMFFFLNCTQAVPP